jgi:acetyl/propionyl-CoA carboxylase alpha subunit
VTRAERPVLGRKTWHGLTYGVDLVHEQLRVASGEPLPLEQSQLAIHGAAIEARIYAEDPTRGFLPSTGRIHHLRTPPLSAAVRIDAGVELRRRDLRRRPSL